MTIATIDETHDAATTSWVDSADDPATDFPIQNLPIGMFREAGRAVGFRPGVAIGNRIVDLLALVDAHLLPTAVADSLAGCRGGTLNDFMGRGAEARTALRRALWQGLRQGSETEPAWRPWLVAQAEAEMALPCRIGDYTDFYTGIHHATAVGRLFRPDSPLLPNYKWVPIGYHGRASSIIPSGQAFRRPVGQTMGPGDAVPTVGPSRRLDLELEVGLLIGRGNALGDPVPIADAEGHAFGLVLFNDWSARDLQAWEYQPLGPFLGKSFASTLSPWIVTMEALAPFRVPATARPEGDPAPLAYLDAPADRAQGGVDITLEVLLQTATMRGAGQPPQRLMQSNFRDAYWTLAQMLAHQTVNGCNLQPGDLLGSGTQSGPGPGQGGSLLELSDGGRRPLALANGEHRTFLEDGDSVTLRGRCLRDGFRAIGFGRCDGRVLPAAG